MSMPDLNLTEFEKIFNNKIKKTLFLIVKKLNIKKKILQ